MNQIQETTKKNKRQDQQKRSTSLSVRVAKENAVFLYQLLESYENVMSYSTFPCSKGSAYRDIIIHSPLGMLEEREEVLANIQKSIPLRIL